MKKLTALILALCMVLCCFAATAEEETYEIGIIQLVQHPALDAATQGFKDALTEKLGDKVKFDEQNASGDVPACATIATTLVSNGVDLIMANATPALQAAAAATSEIPILATSITHYGTALDMNEVWKGYTGINVSGTSDLAPLDQQAAMIKELFPDTKTVGLVYCSAEANSVYQIDEVAKYLAEMGIETQRFPFSDSNDLASVTQSACDSVDGAGVGDALTSDSCDQVKVSSLLHAVSAIVSTTHSPSAISLCINLIFSNLFHRFFNMNTHSPAFMAKGRLPGSFLLAVPAIRAVRAVRKRAHKHVGISLFITFMGPHYLCRIFFDVLAGDHVQRLSVRGERGVLEPPVHLALPGDVRRQRLLPPAVIAAVQVA